MTLGVLASLPLLLLGPAGLTPVGVFGPHLERPLRAASQRRLSCSGPAPGLGLCLYRFRPCTTKTGFLGSLGQG